MLSFDLPCHGDRIHEEPVRNAELYIKELEMIYSFANQLSPQRHDPDGLLDSLQ